MPYHTLDIQPGRQFGKLTVMFEAAPIDDPSGKKLRAFMCKCECGTDKVIRLAHLNHGKTKSCGCLASAQQGLSTHPIYKVWAGMKVRTKPSHHEAHLYHDRGIGICAEWSNSFLEFMRWAQGNGFAEGLTIDRIDNEKGYQPDNCRWVTATQNGRNRRVTLMVQYRGEIRPLMDVLDELSISSRYHAVRSRIERGWSADRAVDTPMRQGNYHRKSIAA